MQCSVQVCSVQQELWHAYDYDLSYGMSCATHNTATEYRVV